MTVPAQVLAAVRSIPHPRQETPMTMPNDDEWCREESCRHRHWRSGSMPTHKRGANCPSPTVTAPDLSAEERAVVARFEAAEVAPESDDQALWAALSDLIPCNDFAGCGDECECAEGELRLAVQRLIVAERVHHADCGDDEDCCNATAQRARLVNKAAAVSPDHLRARRAALRGQQ